MCVCVCVFCDKCCVFGAILTWCSLTPLNYDNGCIILNIKNFVIYLLQHNPVCELRWCSYICMWVSLLPTFLSLCEKLWARECAFFFLSSRWNDGIFTELWNCSMEWGWSARKLSCWDVRKKKHEGRKKHIRSRTKYKRKRWNTQWLLRWKVYIRALGTHTLTHLEMVVIFDAKMVCVRSIAE